MISRLYTFTVIIRELPLEDTPGDLAPYAHTSYDTSYLAREYGPWGVFFHFQLEPDFFFMIKRGPFFASDLRRQFFVYLVLCVPNIIKLLPELLNILFQFCLLSQNPCIINCPVITLDKVCRSVSNLKWPTCGNREGCSRARFRTTLSSFVTFSFTLRWELLSRFSPQGE